MYEASGKKECVIGETDGEVSKELCATSSIVDSGMDMHISETV